jgi:riboflavin synthase
LTVELPPELERYVVFKGSIALDGISLTVAAVDGPRVSAAIIPHTWENTTLRCRAMGDSLHVEVDIIAKYVEKLLSRLTIPQPGRQPGPQPEIQ